MASAVSSTSLPTVSATRSNGSSRRRRVELHRTAEEEIRVDAAEHDVGVGRRRRRAAAAVAGRARHRAGALRADAQQSALVDPGDRAAAGADGADVDHRHLDRQSPLDLEVGREGDLSVDHRGAVGRGAPHVERHQPLDAGQLRQVPGADDAARRAGHRQVDRRTGGRLEFLLASIRLDDDGAAAEAGVPQPPLHGRQIRADFRLEIGVGDGCGGPLVLLPARQHVVGDGDGHVRPFLGDDRRRASLVLRLDEGEHQADGDRLDLARGLQLAHDPAQPGLVERLEHDAVAVDPLVELVAVAVLDQRRRLDPEDVVVRLAVAALDEGHIAEAPRRKVGDVCALALQDGVGGDRRAEPHVADAGAVVDAPQPFEDSVRRIPGRGQVLPDADRAPVAVIGDEVRERAADIDADQVTRHAPALCPFPRSNVPAARSARNPPPRFPSRRSRDPLRQPPPFRSASSAAASASCRIHTSPE